MQSKVYADKAYNDMSHVLGAYHGLDNQPWQLEYDEYKVKDMGSCDKRNDNMKRNEIFNIFKMGIENKYDIKGELNEKWEEDWSSDDMKRDNNIKFVRNTLYGELKLEDMDIDEKLKGNKKKLMGITNIKKIKKINIIILR